MELHAPASAPTLEFHMIAQARIQQKAAHPDAWAKESNRDRDPSGDHRQLIVNIDLYNRNYSFHSIVKPT